MTAVSTTLGWRLVNPRCRRSGPRRWAECNEQLQEKFAISRERQDEFALRSHRLADAAWNEGFYDDLTCRCPAPRSPGTSRSARDTTLEKLADADPVVPRGGHHHGRQRVAAQRRRVGPGPRLARRGRRGSGARRWPRSPAGRPPRSSRRCSGMRRSRRPSRRCGARDRLVRHRRGRAQRGVRGAVAACVDAWGVDPEIVNAKGGAIAIGHPLGASGGRILGTLVKRMRDGGHRWGVAAICIGVGQGLAVVLENEDA